MKKDFFAHKASSYDKNKSRVENVDNIANAVRNAIPFNKNMHIADFGSGTGLLLERVAPQVGKITAIDISSSMNEQLNNKRSQLSCELEILEVDLSKTYIDHTFDGIISSMTMHHVQNIPAMFDKFYAMVKEGGFIAIADLDKEDGSFHSEDAGVFHCGFERQKIQQVAIDAGFKNVALTTASAVHKPQGSFDVFLLVGYK